VSPIMDKVRTKFVTIRISHVLSYAGTHILTTEHKPEIINKNKALRIFLLKAHIPSNSMYTALSNTILTVLPTLHLDYTQRSHSYRQFRY
jgi:hypothetical protein